MNSLDRLIKEKLQRDIQVKTRRHFIKDCVAGMGGLALGSLFMGCNSFLSDNKKGQYCPYRKGY